MINVNIKAHYDVEIARGRPVFVYPPLARVMQALIRRLDMNEKPF